LDSKFDKLLLNKIFVAISMSKKKKKPSTKSKKKSINSCQREKVCGVPTPVKPLRPVSEHHNRDGEIYPKIFFKESLWTKFKRFIGLVP
jgi:hypothetical protein